MNALIHWPEWAKLARIAGRTRAKARRAQRTSGALSLFVAIAAQLDPGVPMPDWLIAERLADTMREIAQNTRRGTDDRVRVVEVANG